MKSVTDRRVEPELLDTLRPDDPRARRSRRDLLRLNGIMKHPSIMAGALSRCLQDIPAPQIVELGAGDGHFLLTVVRRFRTRPFLAGRTAERGGEAAPTASIQGNATLLDRLDSLDPGIRDAFQMAGWHVQAQTADVFDWLRAATPKAANAVVANLFLHHFPPKDLSELLRLAARSTKLFIALEPRRSWFPMLCGRLLWLVGSGPVTRHDAMVSIRAGFAGRELSSLWPDPEKWQLQEHTAGLFSHLFIARQKE